MRGKRQANDAHVIIAKWLTRFCEVYGKTNSPELLATYIEALGDLSVANLTLAFPEAVRRDTGYMPTPGQVRFALQSLHDKFGAQIPGAHANCKVCGGTGFLTVAARDPLTNQELEGDYKWAVRCTEAQSSDPPQREYRAVDCPEGRTFLLKLAEMAGKTRDEIAEYWEKWLAKAK